MPNANTAISSLVLNIANIVLLFFILRTLVYRPVRKFLDARQEKIRQETEEAERQLAEAEKAREESRLALDNMPKTMEAERKRILREAEERAEEITESAREEAEGILAKSREKAEREAEKVREDMRESIADLSVEIAGKLMEREIDKGGSGDLIEKFFDRVG